MRWERSTSLMLAVRRPEMICAISCSMRLSGGGLKVCRPPRNARICSKNEAAFAPSKWIHSASAGPAV